MVIINILWFALVGAAFFSIFRQVKFEDKRSKDRWEILSLISSTTASIVFVLGQYIFLATVSAAWWIIPIQVMLTIVYIAASLDSLRSRD